jgi:paraquat-inducible protein A
MALPFLSTVSLGVRTESTIYRGVLELTREGAHFLAGLVFVASVLVPVLKILGVLVLARLRARGRPAGAGLERILAFIGPWSMLDVFLLAIATSIFRFSDYMTVEPEAGSLAFGLVVVLTLVATERLKHAPDAQEGAG